MARIASLGYIIQCQSKWQIVYLFGELICLRFEIKHSMVYLLVQNDQTFDVIERQSISLSIFSSVVVIVTLSVHSDWHF